MGFFDGAARARQLAPRRMQRGTDFSTPRIPVQPYVAIGAAQDAVALGKMVYHS